MTWNWPGTRWNKAVKAITPVHQAQALHYLRLATEIEVALILNFGEKPDFKRQVFDNERKEDE